MHHSSNIYSTSPTIHNNHYHNNHNNNNHNNHNNNNHNNKNKNYHNNNNNKIKKLLRKVKAKAIN